MEARTRLSPRTWEAVRERQAVLADWAVARWAVAAPTDGSVDVEPEDIESEGTEEDQEATATKDDSPDR